MAAIAARCFKITRLCSRKFSCACTHRSTNTQGRMIGKMLANNLERKIQATKNAPRAVKLLDGKRAKVLNKTYMANISEVLCFGGFDHILDKGVQITRVNVRDTNTVEVYWLANDDEDPIEVQNMLSSIAGKVGSQLMYANMSGYVPHIVFKRDLAAINVEETKKLLHKVALETSMQEDLSIAVDGVQEPLEVPESDPPKMRMDTLGLPHDRIITRIKESKRYSYPLRVPIPPTTKEFQASVSSHDNTSVTVSVDQQFKRKKELKRFITQYQKSALRSGCHKRNLKQREMNQFYFEDDLNDQNDSNLGEFEDSQEEERQ